MGRILKGSVELKIRFFGIWIHSEVFSDLHHLFVVFVKILFFLECAVTFVLAVSNDRKAFYLC